MKIVVLFFILISNIIFSQNIENIDSVEAYEFDFFNEFPNVRDISISNNQAEMYFTIEGFKKEFSFIAVSKKINGVWQRPKVAPFSGKDKDLEPFLSPDNLKLFFASNRAIESNNPKEDMDIWYVERESLNTQWSKPIHIEAPINTDKDEFYPAITNSGNLYFTSAYEEDSKGKEDIYISKLVDGKYIKPMSLGDAINSETYEFNAYVSPDERIIIFSSYRRSDTVGGTDLYISFKDQQDNWKPAINLGEGINSDKIDYCPFIDFKSNTVYFTSERSEQNQNYETHQNIQEILNEMKSHPNGLSRIFKVNLTEILSKNKMN
ncbi:TolB family protein [Urechidicola croceus]|uniref:Exo-alpha-sialidase n=1 Tax=Urechidicola croceus TaxID=1850246 RepID=A0A1D8P8Q3_9FLAO|nr:PD40 domain-containing protein [Urechidicola croceus]AOW20958.1 hypothetical protein LPB138_09850 [Urechidicola croceus]